VIPPIEIAALFREHARGLTLIARARFPDSTADDLVQEAYIRLAQQSVLPDDPLAWLARAVHNLAIDAMRKDGRRRSREREFYDQCVTWFEGTSLPVGDELTGEEATSALLKLREADREIVVAHLWGNLSFRQIASAFDVSSSTANRQYNQAITQLREILGVKHVK
jgi:RNA polymerase sigma-70 factor (ECF subfamily)